MSEISSDLQFPYDAAPDFGSAYELRPGLYWAQCPLSFLTKQVNIWLFRDDDGFDLIDVGMNTDEARHAFLTLHASLGKPDLKRLIGTHGHVDHLGLAGWVCHEFGITLTMPSLEYFQLLGSTNSTDTEVNQKLHRFAGSPPELIAQMETYRPWFRAQFPDFPDTFTPIEDGETLTLGGRDWQVMTGSGHSIAQLALYSAAEKILIVADHLLPNYAAVLPSLPALRNRDPVQEQFDMLDRFCALPDDTLVLPSHGLPFYGIKARSRQIRDHHGAVMAQFLGHCADWKSSHALFMAVRGRPMLIERQHFPICQAISHMTHLARQGHVETRMDGETMLFRAV